MFGSRPSFSGTPKGRETMLFKPLPTYTINPEEEIAKQFALDKDDEQLEQLEDDERKDVIQELVLKKPKLGILIFLTWSHNRILEIKSKIETTKEKPARTHNHATKPNILEMQAKVLEMELKKSAAGLKFYEKGLKVFEKLDTVLDDVKVWLSLNLKNFLRR